MMCAVEYRGLCTTCKHRETCQYAREPGRCIMHCDEFEGETALLSTGSMSELVEGLSAKTEVPPDIIRKRAYNGNAPMGLCRTCGKFPDCKFSKPEGGVWSCEEYE